MQMKDRAFASRCVMCGVESYSGVSALSLVLESIEDNPSGCSEHGQSQKEWDLLFLSSPPHPMDYQKRGRLVLPQTLTFRGLLLKAP